MTPRTTADKTAAENIKTDTTKADTTKANRRARPYGLAGAGLLLVAGGLFWGGRAHHAPQHTGPRPLYTASGYGGFVAPPSPVASTGPGEKGRQPHASPIADPVRPARDAYNAGRYAEAEARAQQVVALAAHSKRASAHRQAAFARQVLAYAAARRRDLTLARVRFAALETAAAALPDRGKVPAPLGLNPPTLEADGAYQHAVCTAALGDKAGAEAEYRTFMTRYPESPLVQAAIKRIARLHGGDVPREDEAVWRAAMRTGRQREKAKAREASLCGPACLAELLRRAGKAADVHSLAAQMGTSDRGTTLAALAQAAERRGWQAQGVALTPKGLAEQPLPLIALITPGHYVLVEAVTPQAVTVWDPDARGLNQPGRRSVSAAEWGRVWRGLALALRAASTPVRTASR